MNKASENLATARQYLQALEQGKPELASSLFAADIEQIEYPNLLKPQGDRRDRAALAADGKKGLQILRRQSYEIKNAIAEDDRVALEVFWQGELAIDLAGLKAGDVMTAHSAMFLDFVDGKISRQRNYDCFPPLKPKA